MPYAGADTKKVQVVMMSSGLFEAGVGFLPSKSDFSFCAGGCQGRARSDGGAAQPCPVPWPKTVFPIPEMGWMG